MARSGELSLKRLAQERIESGELSCDPSARMWGSHGSGAVCSLCERSIGPEEIEYEVEMKSNDGGHTTLHFHRACHSIWHGECQAALAR